MTRTLALALTALLVVACATTPDLPEADPRGDRDWFVRHYEGDARNAALQSLDDYLLWVERFHEGWVVYPRGWNQTVEEIVGRAESPDPGTLRDRLVRLGRRIGGDWAKDNEVRKVDNRLLSLWGDGLRTALDADALPAYLDSVESDLARLIDGELVADRIRRGRYFEVDADDPFSAF